MKIINEQMTLNSIKRQARRIAQNLVTELRIPTGDNLTYLLEAPSAKNNLDAVSQWVLTQKGLCNENIENYQKIKRNLESKLNFFEGL